MRPPPHLTVMPPLSLKPYARPPARRLPFPLQEPRCRIFSLARQGLFAGIGALGLESGDEVLVPAYHHGSEVEALVCAGLVCRFYEGTRYLEPGEEELEALLGPRVRALYLIHYLGLPQDAARWRAWCDEHGLLLIEDAAQAWLGSRDGTPVGSHGDLSIFCLYKTIGLPDGAAVISTHPPKTPRRGHHIGAARVALRHMSYLAQRWGWLADLRHRLRRTGASDDPEREFGLGDVGRAPYRATGFLLAREAYDAAQAARSANYAFLLERLGRFVPEPFGHPSEGASPFGFPIWSERKDELLGRLAHSGIIASNFWPVLHPRVPAADFPRATALKSGVVALPVHQELGKHDLERIVGAVLDAAEFAGDPRTSRKGR